jgi:carboxyl-terminal processing protease
LAVRVRSWFLARGALLFLLVPLLVAGSTILGVREAQTVIFASEASPDLAVAPVASATVTRQAYDLLLDNYVTPPSPSALLAATALELAKRAADPKPEQLAALTIAEDASREEAWASFELWFDRVARALAPVVDRAALDELAVRALAAAVSEHHTRYLDPRQNEEHQAWRRGEVRYEGIGARLRRPSTVVLEVFDESPAAKAGIRTGDRIVEVDGESVSGGTSENAIGKIRGPLGSKVEVAVERRGTPGILRFALERGEIKLPFVRWDVIQRPDGHRLGYLQIRGFPEPGVDDRVGQALADLDTRSIDGLILDLRGNSGGRIDVGMKVASRFLRDGIVFQQVDRSGRERQVRPTGGLYWEHSIPVVTLVDGGTASMGEILGSALQESGVTRVVGTQTSGSVAGARLFPLGNGGAMQITVLTITSGKGAVLNDRGVTPDMAVELSDNDLVNGVDAQLETGIQLLTARPRAAGVSMIPVSLYVRLAA